MPQAVGTLALVPPLVRMRLERSAFQQVSDIGQGHTNTVSERERRAQLPPRVGTLPGIVGRHERVEVVVGRLDDDLSAVRGKAPELGKVGFGSHAPQRSARGRRWRLACRAWHYLRSSS